MTRVVLVYASSCINPFIYAAKYGEFQTGVRRMVASVTGKPMTASVDSAGGGQVQMSAMPSNERGMQSRSTVT